MKVLSLLQPWATLAVIGAKRIETRSWNTKYRGPLLIHASAGKQGLKIMDDPQLKKFLTPLFFDDPKDKLPLGAIIGKVEIVDTAKTSDILLMKDAGVPIRVRDRKIPDSWDQEIAFGDYSSGRYGWLLSNPVAFPAIIPAKGKLGLWEYQMPEKIGFNLKGGGHASFDGMPDTQTVEAIEAMTRFAREQFRIY
jgi:activating signal cointegrator 1